MHTTLKTCLLSSGLGWFFAVAGLAQEESGEVVVKRWLATHAGVECLKIGFTQTRKLASLKAPLREHGVLWLDRGAKRFRWQIGEPPKTIVTRRDSSVLIVRPGAKKYEVRTMQGGQDPAWAALARGFPRDWAEFERKYQLLEVKTRGEERRIVTRPLDGAARGVTTFAFVVDRATYRLRALDMTFRDGSSQQISFTSVERVEALGDDVFSPDLTGYQATTF